MNKTITIFVALLLLSYFKLWGQYEPIFKDSIVSFDITLQGFDYAFPGYNITIRDKVIENEKEYQKVFWNSSFVGLFREDSLAAKAWYWDNMEDEERLISDLDLMVGDTFAIASENFYCDSNNQSNDYTIVESIDTLDGNKRINFDCWHSFDRLRFIERVGPNAGIIYFSDNEQKLGSIACQKYENSELVFQYYPEEPDCSFYTNIEELDISYDIKVYPNPFTGFIIFESDEFRKDFKIEISNIEGKLLLDKIVYSKELIRTSNLEEGIYFYRLIYEDKIETGKIIKIKK